MKKGFWIPAGLVAAGVLGCMLIPKAPPSQTAPQAIAELALPDMDTDGRPERLRILPTEQPGQVAIKLDSSNGNRTHDMFTTPGTGTMSFAKRGDGWALLGTDETPLATVKLYQAPKAKVPDLIVLTPDQGRRFVFIDRGFLKLHAHELIAGFSVGLVMMNDSVEALEAIGGPVQKDGTWSLPFREPIPLKIQFDDEKQVTRITFESKALLSRQGFHVGVQAGELEKMMPGKREANHWMSPRYGLIGHIGADQRVEALSVTSPWKDESIPNKPAP